MHLLFSVIFVLLEGSMYLLSSLGSFQTSITFLCEGEIWSCIELLERTNRAIRKVSGWQHSKGFCFPEDALPCSVLSPGWEVSSWDSITGFPGGQPSCSLLPASLFLCYLLSLVFALSDLGFFLAFLLVLFVCSQFSLFRATCQPPSIFEKRKTMLTDLNFGR